MRIVINLLVIAETKERRFERLTFVFTIQVHPSFSYAPTFCISTMSWFCWALFWQWHMISRSEMTKTVVAVRIFQQLKWNCCKMCLCRKVVIDKILFPFRVVMPGKMIYALDLSLISFRFALLTNCFYNKHEQAWHYHL